jgi:hypothetical protein
MYDELHVPLTLTLGKELPFDTRSGEAQSRQGRGGEEKIPSPLPGIEIPVIQSLA